MWNRQRNLEKILSSYYLHHMPSMLELKKAQDFLNVQITQAEREEWEAEEACLWAEEAQVAAEIAWREEQCEREHAREQECLVAEARVQAEEEQCVREEEERLAVEGDFCEAEGPSQERAPR